MLRDALLDAGVPAEQIVVIPDEQAATDTALREAQPGDLLLIFADAITRTWKQVIQFRPEAPERRSERPRHSRPEPAIRRPRPDGRRPPRVRARRARRPAGARGEAD